MSVVELDAPRRPLAATIGSYVRLTKPRVIELLLVTAVPPMILAQQGMPSLGLIAAVVIGGALAAGGANTINCWIERDRDQLMRRTLARPLPQGEIAGLPRYGDGLVIARDPAALWAPLPLAAALDLVAKARKVAVDEHQQSVDAQNARLAIVRDPAWRATRRRWRDTPFAPTSGFPPTSCGMGRTCSSN